MHRAAMSRRAVLRGRRSVLWIGRRSSDKSVALNQVHRPGHPPATTCWPPRRARRRDTAHRAGSSRRGHGRATHVGRFRHDPEPASEQVLAISPNRFQRTEPPRMGIAPLGGPAHHDRVCWEPRSLATRPLEPLRHRSPVSSVARSRGIRPCRYGRLATPRSPSFWRVVPCGRGRCDSPCARVARRYRAPSRGAIGSTRAVRGSLGWQQRRRSAQCRMARRVWAEVEQPRGPKSRDIARELSAAEMRAFGTSRTRPASTIRGIPTCFRTLGPAGSVSSIGAYPMPRSALSRALSGAPYRTVRACTSPVIDRSAGGTQPRLSPRSANSTTQGQYWPGGHPPFPWRHGL